MIIVGHESTNKSDHYLFISGGTLLLVAGHVLDLALLLLDCRALVFVRRFLNGLAFLLVCRLTLLLLEQLGHNEEDQNYVCIKLLFT